MIEANLHETPKYGGWVESKGPRYCPSIEDKVVRFKDKPSHQVIPCMAYASMLHCKARHANHAYQSLQHIIAGKHAACG